MAKMAILPNGKFKKYYLKSFNGQNGLGQLSTSMLEDIGVKKDMVLHSFLVPWPGGYQQG